VDPVKLNFRGCKLGLENVHTTIYIYICLENVCLRHKHNGEIKFKTVKPLQLIDTVMVMSGGGCLEYHYRTNGSWIRNIVSTWHLNRLSFKVLR